MHDTKKFWFITATLTRSLYTCLAFLAGKGKFHNTMKYVQSQNIHLHSTYQRENINKEIKKHELHHHNQSRFLQTWHRLTRLRNWPAFKVCDTGAENWLLLSIVANQKLKVLAK